MSGKHSRTKGAKPVAIESPVGTDDQYSTLGKHKWSVSRLIELSRSMEVMEIPLAHMNIYYNFYEKMSLRDLVQHMRTTLDADMSCPIILDEDGEIMDGRHRLMRALLDEMPTIKAVRFAKNPRPCEVVEE